MLIGMLLSTLLIFLSKFTCILLPNVGQTSGRTSRQNSEFFLTNLASSTDFKQNILLFCLTVWLPVNW